MAAPNQKEDATDATIATTKEVEEVEENLAAPGEEEDAARNNLGKTPVRKLYVRCEKKTEQL